MSLHIFLCDVELRYINSNFKEIDLKPILFLHNPNNYTIGDVIVQNVTTNDNKPLFFKGDKIASIVAYTNVYQAYTDNDINISSIINALGTIFTKNKNTIYIYHKNQYDIAKNYLNFTDRIDITTSIIKNINKKFMVFLR